jgi:hypothetical protein
MRSRTKLPQRGRELPVPRRPETAAATADLCSSVMPDSSWSGVAVCGAYYSMAYTDNNGRYFLTASLRQFFDAYARCPGTSVSVRGVRP